MERSQADNAFIAFDKESFLKSPDTLSDQYKTKQVNTGLIMQIKAAVIEQLGTIDDIHLIDVIADKVLSRIEGEVQLKKPNVLPEVMAINAIYEGKKEDAIKCVNQLMEQVGLAKDLLVGIVSSVFTFIGKKYGEESLFYAWRYVSDDVWRPLIEAFKKMSHDDIVEVFIKLHNGLGSRFHIEEDRQKSTIFVTACGSGGKLMKEGKYENTARTSIDGGITKASHSWSCNRKGMPYYCIHAPLWYQILPREWGFDMLDYEWGRQYDDDGNQVDEPCKITIFKVPRAIRTIDS